MSLIGAEYCMVHQSYKVPPPCLGGEWRKNYNKIYKKHVQRTCLMYHAAWKVEFQPFNRPYSQLTFFL